MNASWLQKVSSVRFGLLLTAMFLAPPANAQLPVKSEGTNLITHRADNTLPTTTNGNWGEKEHGVRLSISISNNVLKAGTSSVIQCSAQNSTKDLRYFDRSPEAGTQVFLTSSNNKKYRLTIDRSQWPGGGPCYTLERAERRIYFVPLKVAKDVPAGEYKLQAIASMYLAVEPPNMNNPLLFFKPKSNILKVRVE